MGNALSESVSQLCPGILAFGAGGPSAESVDDMLQSKLASLKVGARFMKKAMLGLSTTEIEVFLSDDATLLKWCAVQASSAWLGSGDKEKGYVDLTSVADVRAEGPQSFVLTDRKKEELCSWTAETAKIRDMWVGTLRELLESWTASGERPKEAALSADATSDKAEYFKQRAEEVEARAKQRDQMKLKYSGGGMKYTALALAGRSEKS